ncbi:hypothetical protein WOLCODRAFT_137505 [Wolfiporia cocos MD-104 SS10]|uniref:Zn(2)-C6 fungal-type domain-containing protein n=1 Tax=Wolfiporia cocos (strain MD-104) TaxID=742152 RepID=A0A2H3JIC5_WOLCO|nr:hypothetical protein WOLCODRAFT_137505 [Wolfiporia cocos MD-104 SS10]
MDRAYTADDRAGCTAPSRPRSSANRSNSSPSLSRDRAGPVDQSLLTPVVRSKRTPIACTECRRRQVKCTGGTPQCERCEKKGVKCEYIPIHQQRLAAAAAQSPHGAINLPVGHTTRTTSRSVPSSPIPWPHSGRPYQTYASDPSYVMQNEWQDQYGFPTQTSPQHLTHHSAHSAPAIGAGYGRVYHQTDAPHSVHSPASSPQALARGYSPPHQVYSGSPSLMYGDARVVGGVANVDARYDYTLSVESPPFPQDTLPHLQDAQGQSSDQYYHGQQVYYDNSMDTAGHCDTVTGWMDPAVGTQYSGFQGHPYP